MRRYSIVTILSFIGTSTFSVVSGCKDSVSRDERLNKKTKDCLRASISDADRLDDWYTPYRQSHRKPADQLALQLLESPNHLDLDKPFVYEATIIPASSKKDVFRVTVKWLEKGQSTNGVYFQLGDEIVAQYEKEDWKLEYDLTNDHYLRMRDIGVFTRLELLPDRPRTIFVPRQLINRNLKVGIICGDGNLSNSVKPYFFHKSRDQLTSIFKIKQALSHTDPDYEYPDFLRPDFQRGLDYLEAETEQDYSIPRMLYGWLMTCESDHTIRALLVDWLSEEQNVIGFFLEDDQGNTYEIREVDLTDESTFERTGLTYECEVVWGDARNRPTKLPKDERYLKFLDEMSENDLHVGLLTEDGKTESIGLYKITVGKNIFGYE